MDWKNALKDGLPKHGQQVLISIHGVYFVTHYNESEQSFETPGKTKKFKVKDHTIYWQEIEAPEKS